MVVFAFEKISHSLLQRKFKLPADHEALKYVFNTLDRHVRIAGWTSISKLYSDQYHGMQTPITFSTKSKSKREIYQRNQNQILSHYLNTLQEIRVAKSLKNSKERPMY